MRHDEDFYDQAGDRTREHRQASLAAGSRPGLYAHLLHGYTWDDLPQYFNNPDMWIDADLVAGLTHAARQFDTTPIAIWVRHTRRGMSTAATAGRFRRHWGEVQTIRAAA